MTRKEQEAQSSRMFSIVKSWYGKRDSMRIEDFCSKQGISVSKLRYWIAKYEKKQTAPLKFDSVWLSLIYDFRIPLLTIALNALLIFLFFYTSRVEHGELVYTNHVITWLCGLIVIPSFIFLYIASDKNETNTATFRDTRGNAIGSLEWNTGRIIKGNFGCAGFVFMAYIIIYILASIYNWIWG